VQSPFRQESPTGELHTTIVAVLLCLYGRLSIKVALSCAVRLLESRMCMKYCSQRFREHAHAPAPIQPPVRAHSPILFPLA
jgi:hypothetical protein